MPDLIGELIKSGVLPETFSEDQFPNWITPSIVTQETRDFFPNGDLTFADMSFYTDSDLLCCLTCLSPQPPMPVPANAKNPSGIQHAKSCNDLRAKVGDSIAVRDGVCLQGFFIYKIAYTLFCFHFIMIMSLIFLHYPLACSPSGNLLSTLPSLSLPFSCI